MTPGQEHRYTIAAIDDDPLFLQALKRSLHRTPYRLLTETDPNHAVGLLGVQSVQLVLLDLQMPGKSGLELLSDITSLYPDIPVIMITGCGSINLAVQAIQSGAADFLEKPYDVATLHNRIAGFYQLWLQRISQNSTKQFNFPDLVGESPDMLRLRSQILRVAGSDVPVLIYGESGTGKELVAQAIHQHSDRRQCPFYAVDCAAISESVLESELFGYEKGAFTGATSNSIGLIRSADSGTLFLDELGEIPIKMQAKLLRSLQQQEVRPVGGTRTHKVDIRIVAATNRNLEAEVAEGNFRADLYYRIAAITLQVPPLRERRQDLNLLIPHILKRYGHSQDIRLSPEAQALLENYSWPGNIRELENVLRRALALSEGPLLKPDDLPATLLMDRLEESTGEVPDNDSLAAYERLAIQKALSKAANNKRQAAALLGIGEATLYRKLKLYNLSD